MATRFSKRVKILPGIKLNLSKTGISTSIGVRGASVNIGKKGIRTTVGIPGTGLSSSTLHKAAAPTMAPTPPHPQALSQTKLTDGNPNVVASTFLISFIVVAVALGVLSLRYINSTPAIVAVGFIVLALAFFVSRTAALIAASLTRR